MYEHPLVMLWGLLCTFPLNVTNHIEILGSVYPMERIFLQNCSPDSCAYITTEKTLASTKLIYVSLFRSFKRSLLGTATVPVQKRFYLLLFLGHFIMFQTISSCC